MSATKLFLNKHFKAEKKVAHYVHKLMTAGCDAVPANTEGLEGYQKLAVETACCSPLSVLYGYPGTGKTTTLRKIIQSWDESGMVGVVLAPAAKAAKRAEAVLSENDRDGNPPSYGYAPGCMTTFRGLEYNPSRGYGRNRKNHFDWDYVVLEESSMEGIEDAASLLEAIDPAKTRILISGDPRQLPSVGAGNFLNDLINVPKISKTQLTKIYRQGPNSGIVHNCQRILQGKLPVKEDAQGVLFKDFFFTQTNSEEETLQKILSWTSEKIPRDRGFDPIEDIQPLSPGKNAVIGTKNLNEKLRDLLNGGNPGKYRSFRLNDKVINRKNYYQENIVNGDVGRVIEIGDKGMVVNFGAGTGSKMDGIVTVEGAMAENIYPAFAYTVHASQGSEYRCQILPVHKCHYILLFQNLIYTALSRGKELSMLVGDVNALKHAVQNTVTDKRQTALVDFIDELFVQSL